MHVGEVAEVLHHLRSRERLRFDAIHHAEIDRLLRSDAGRETDYDADGDDRCCQAHRLSGGILHPIAD